MSTTTSKSIYPIRSKFANKLVDAGLPETALDYAITIAMNLKYGEMFRVLWKLSFAESYEDGLKMLGCTSFEEEVGTFIPVSMIKAFRNELRRVYSLTNDGFLDVSEPEHRKYFEKFSKEMDDEILSVGIYQRIVGVIKSSTPGWVARTDYLLHSPSEKNFFGGLRSLRLKDYEANALKGKVSCIAELFEQVINTPLWREHVEEPSGWRAFGNLKQMMEEQGVEFPSKPDIQVAIPEQHVGEENISCFSEKPEAFEKTDKASNMQDTIKKVDIAEVMTNLDLFRSFISVCDELNKEGFELDNVMANLEGIRNIVKGCDALS